MDKLQVDRRIQSRVKKQMEKAQKEYYLNEKMKAIQKELGRKDEKGNEIDELKKKIEQAKMPKEVEEKAVQELKRLEAMPPMSAEATVSRNYLDWLIAVPWHKKTRENRDLKHAGDRCSTRITTASRRSRTASSSSSPSARWSRSRRRRSSRSPDLRASARPRSPSRSRAR